MVAKTTEQVARALHTCSICGRKIQPGEQYRRRRQDRHTGEYRIIKTCSDHYTVKAPAND